MKSLSSLKMPGKVSSVSDVKTYINLFGGDELPIQKRLEGLIYSPEDLTYAFLDFLLDYKITVSTCVEKERFDIRKLLIDVVQRVGFLAFNIAKFRSLVSSLYYNPNTSRVDKSFLSELTTLLSDPFFNRNVITERGYWLIYVLVEVLRGEGYGTRDSFRRVGEHLNMAASSVHRRYFEMKKEAKEKNQTVDKIINQFWLHRALDENLRSIIEKD